MSLSYMVPHIAFSCASDAHWLDDPGYKAMQTSLCHVSKCSNRDTVSCTTLWTQTMSTTTHRDLTLTLSKHNTIFATKILSDCFKVSISSAYTSLANPCFLLAVYQYIVTCTSPTKWYILNSTSCLLYCIQINTSLALSSFMEMWI